jgi:hypothetical protein
MGVMAQLKADKEYHELTEKQTAVVDTKAEHPGYKPARIAEKASEQIPNDDITDSYVRQILNKHDNLIQERREILDNQRETGEEKTVGDPFQGQLNTDSQGYQGIKDRPHKSNGDTNGHESEGGDTIQIEIARDDIEELLSQDELDEFSRSVARKVLNRAFAQ